MVVIGSIYFVGIIVVPEEPELSFRGHCGEGSEHELSFRNQEPLSNYCLCGLCHCHRARTRDLALSVSVSHNPVTFHHGTPCTASESDGSLEIMRDLTNSDATN
jgi:hypothetical protein